MGIRYLDGPRLQRSLIAASAWVEASRDDLNRINVYPVPDGDTGTNFSMTLRAVADAVQTLHDPTLPDVTKAMAESCVLSAHGNSGLLLSQFLLGFREHIADKTIATCIDVSRGFRSGADRLYASLDTPVEGTILTVCREVALAAEKVAPKTNDLADLMHHSLARGHEALARTPELLESLRQAGVVDAGGKAFIRLLEGVTRLIRGEPLHVDGTPAPSAPNVAARVEVEVDRDYRYCTEVLVRGPAHPPTMEIRERLRAHGGSIVVLTTDDLVKIHVHTNDPEAVYRLASEWGTVEGTKADDMREQHDALHVETENRIAVVVDSTCDIPDSTIDEHGVIVVPIQLMDGTRTYLDRVDIHGADLYERMRRDSSSFTTSQPAPGAFAEAFSDALSSSAEVLCLTVGGRLSGTVNAAKAAARIAGEDAITVFDSRSTSLGLGMLALRAQEMADQGTSVTDIVAELNRVRDQSGALVAFDTLEHLVRSGRIGRARGWIGTLLDVKPVFELNREGEVAPVAKARGREAVRQAILDELDRRLTPRPVRLRLGVVHADAAELAEDIRREVERRFQPYECLVGHVTAAIGVHSGPGAWAVFYQIEDGPDPAAGNNPRVDQI